MIKTVLLVAILAIFYGQSMRIHHHNAFTNFITHVAVPELFKKVDTKSQQFARLAKEELNKINAAAGIPSSNATGVQGNNASAQQPSSPSISQQTQPSQSVKKNEGTTNIKTTSQSATSTKSSS